MREVYASLPQKQRLMQYAALMRLHRPIGIWLLLWPCWWGIFLAQSGLPDLQMLLLFTLGAALMRSAGCIINDMADRRFDAQIERTKTRPLASGAIGLREAAALLMVLLLASLLIVLQLRPVLLYYAAGALLLVAAYPFMKRITYWPQAFLGLTFNLGAVFGWVAAVGAPEMPAFWLYLSGICWTIGYDTIYAHQDIEDDLKIGVKSTAIRFGAKNKRWIAGFYAASVLFMLMALAASSAPAAAYAAPVLMAWHFSWQLRRFRPAHARMALKLFKSNGALGFAIALILLAAAVLKDVIGSQL